MNNVKDKIKKLMSLATSPNENEARAALLKAKKLMMEHKISEMDIEEKSTELVHLTVQDVRWTTDSGDIWAVDLCRVIGENYMCATAWSHEKGKRTYTLCVTGLGEDPEVCADVIRFAMGVVRNNVKDLERRYTGDARSIRHSYATGFITGLVTAFEDQRQEHTEWGLVEVKPQEVKEYENSLGSRSVKAKVADTKDYLAQLKGYADGSKFNAKAVLEG